MIIAGIDPGSAATGYAFLERRSAGLAVLEFGQIRSRKSQPLSGRLRTIHGRLLELFAAYRPSHLALETAFVAKYPRAALVLGHVRGAVMVAAEQAGLGVYEYEPRLVKNSVVGIGRASKDQVADMICRHLGLVDSLPSADVADALAVAYCHMMRHRENNAGQYLHSRELGRASR